MGRFIPGSLLGSLSDVVGDPRQLLVKPAAWLRDDVLVWSTAVQAAVLLALALLFALLLPPARARLGRRVSSMAPGSLRLLALAAAQSAPWLLLALALRVCASAFEHAPLALLRHAAGLALAWAVIRLVSRLVREPRAARLVAVVAWSMAALNIAGLLEPTLAVLDEIAFTAGTLRISVLLVLKAALVLFVAIWAANLISRLLEQRLRRFVGITPAIQVLASKLVRAGLLTLAVVLALGTVGINLTAFAVFSGAIGVGVGFGLQKVVSNLISGVILLMDSSIKPGDVIQLGTSYGWITQLNARYVSVVTRDGTEHLIPNEDLITERVVNWTYSNERVRLHVPVGVAYGSDIRRTIPLCLEATATVARVLPEPAPVCLLTGFGNNSIDLDVRFWIGDPRSGVDNVKSDVMLAIWDSFRSHGISFPFPQLDLHVIEPVPFRRAAPDPAAP